MNRWYAERKINIHDQGLVIDETTGESIAVTYKGENAPLIAAVPELVTFVQDIIRYLECGAIKTKSDRDFVIMLAREVLNKAEQPYSPD